VEIPNLRNSFLVGRGKHTFTGFLRGNFHHSKTLSLNCKGILSLSQVQQDIIFIFPRWQKPVPAWPPRKSVLPFGGISAWQNYPIL
jgi:hypothetical protein